MPAFACTWSLEIASDKLTLQFWFISNCSVLFGKKAWKIQALQPTGLCLFPLFQVTGPQQTCCAGRQLDYCTLAIHPRTDSVEHSGDDNSVLINLELELRMQSLFAIREPRLLVSSGSISWVLTSWLCFCPVLWIAMCSCDTEHLSTCSRGFHPAGPGSCNNKCQPSTRSSSQWRAHGRLHHDPAHMHITCMWSHRPLIM